MTWGVWGLVAITAESLQVGDQIPQVAIVDAVHAVERQVGHQPNNAWNCV